MRRYLRLKRGDAGHKLVLLPLDDAGFDPGQQHNVVVQVLKRENVMQCCLE